MVALKVRTGGSKSPGIINSFPELLGLCCLYHFRPYLFLLQKYFIFIIPHLLFLIKSEFCPSCIFYKKRRCKNFSIFSDIGIIYTWREGTVSVKFSFPGFFAAFRELRPEIACGTFGTMICKALGMFSITAWWWELPYSPSMVQDADSEKKNSTRDVLEDITSMFFSPLNRVFMPDHSKIVRHQN